MKCQFVSEQLGAYLDDELDPNLAREVKEHLDACPACRTELDRLRELTALLHALPRHAAPDGMDQAVAGRIERSLLLGTPASRPRRYVVLRRVLGGAALAAAVMLLTLGAYVAFFPVQSPPSAPDWDSTALRKDQTGLFRPFAPQDAERPAAGARGEAASREKRENGRVLEEGKALSPTTGNLDGRGASPAPAVVAKAAPAKPTPNFEGPVFEPNRTTMQTEQPPRTAFFRAGGQMKAALSDDRNSAEPEVLNLVVSAADFDAAKKRILAVAESLNIRTVSDLPPTLAFTLKGKLDAGVSGRVAGQVPPPGTNAEAGEKPVPPPAQALGGLATRTAENGKTPFAIDRGLPALVLALDEEKLPSLVARLAAHRLQADEDGNGFTDYVASLDELAVKEGEAGAKTRLSEAATPSKLGEKTSETRDLSGKDLRRVPPLTPPPPATPTAPAGPAPADASKLADSAKSKETQPQTPRLVFVRIFLTHPLPAAQAKPPDVPPPK